MTPISSEGMGRGATPVRNITIIVVDDDAAMRGERGRALQREGYSVTEAATSLDCLKLLDAGVTFDLLITKVSMAPPHGFALGRMARHRNPHQKILYLGGGQTAPIDNEREVINGPILNPPINVAELLDAVKRVLAPEDPPGGIRET